MTTKVPYREQLRLDVLAAARSMLEREGLGALHARSVAQRVNCSVGSIYNVFDDLDGLIIALNMETVSDLGKVLKMSFAGSQTLPLAERLTDLAITYARFAFANANRWRAVFEHTLPESKTLPETYRNDQARLLALIEAIVAEDVQEAAMRERAARALFAAVHGIVALAVESKLVPFDAQGTELEIRFIVKAAASGLRAAL